MSKAKISNGLGIVMLLASLFAGWQTLLTVSVLILLFCDVDAKLKQMMVTVITFYIGLTIVNLGWGLIVDLKDAIIYGFRELMSTISGYLESPIDISKFNSYLLNPISNIVNILNRVVVLLITYAKLIFVVCIISNKPLKENFITKKISEYVTKAVNFINGIDAQN